MLEEERTADFISPGEVAEGGWGRLDTITTQMYTDASDVVRNLKVNLKRKLPEIEWLPEWGKPKGNLPFAIVGGGPSIKYTLPELRGFRTTIAAGSSHDWLIDHGVIPTYCLLLDPDPATANYVRRPSPGCNYLVAASCHPSVFDALEGYPITRWQSATNITTEEYTQLMLDSGMSEAEVGPKPIIGGGCTSGLRCISIAMVFGYRNLHFFGCDSSLDPNDMAHHAYDFVDPENEHLGDVVMMRLGGPDGRLFYVAKYMLSQLDGFKDLVNNYGHAFDVTVHGDGAFAEFMRQRRANIRNKELSNA